MSQGHAEKKKDTEQNLVSKPTLSAINDGLTALNAVREVDTMILRHDDEFLLLASDGFFDMFFSAEAIEFARKELIRNRGDATQAARFLSHEAARVRKSEDNVSIVIIVLRPFWERSCDA